MDIYLVRHAESEGNISGRFNGITDLPLSEKGRRQAWLLGSFFNDIELDKIYTSTLKRTNETASYALPGKAGTFIKMAALNEIDGGDWEGVAWEEIIERWPEANRLWREGPALARLPNGESVDELAKRSIDALMEIVSESKGCDSIAVFSHGTVIKVMVAHVLGLPLDALRHIAWYENSSVTKIKYAAGVFSLEFFNNHSHLPDEDKTVANTAWGREMKNNTKY
ncbi:MAG: histidine phosphatase family protein [Clostridia bacterium]|nr:histidine phosphatase family protein [Clostridia bacterium]